VTPAALDELHGAGGAWANEACDRAAALLTTVRVFAAGAHT
jgi:hypothetical protein